MAATGGDVLEQRISGEISGPRRVLEMVILPLLGVMMIVDLYLIFLWAPTDAILGEVQRIFYFHVPIAMVAFLAFFVVFVCSILYLWKRTPIWDAIAHSAAEIGVVFATLILLTGAIWAKPVWGVWWTWEPRLTTSLILWLIYVAYLMLRTHSPSRTQGATYAAVLGILGFVDVPIVYFAAEWWRTVHPESVVGPLAESGSLDSSMRVVLMLSFLTFTLLFAYLLRERVSLRRADDDLRSAIHSIRTAGRF